MFYIRMLPATTARDVVSDSTRVSFTATTWRLWAHEFDIDDRPLLPAWLEIGNQRPFLRRKNARTHAASATEPRRPPGKRRVCDDLYRAVGHSVEIAPRVACVALNYAGIPLYFAKTMFRKIGFIGADPKLGPAAFL